MRGGILAFVAGAWWLQQQAALPGWWLQAAGLALGASLCAAGAWHARRVAPRWARTCFWAGLAVLGFCYAAWRADVALQDELATHLEGRDVAVVGVVEGLPVRAERGPRFDLALEAPPPGIPRRVSVSWYDFDTAARGAAAQATEVLPGQRWRLTLRLRRPHGNANPHGFDYEAWLLEQGVRATGYVRPERAGERRLMDGFVWRPSTMLHRARAYLRASIERALEGKRYAGVMTALVIGDQRAIAQEDWTLFHRTGIGHLVSISGLHITMVAAAVAAIAGFAWRRVRWGREGAALSVPAQAVAAAAGALAALLYSLLAGWGVPAQRTFFMLLVVASALWAGRLTAASHVLALALGVVVVLDPWAVLAPGFWLSFGAVALIFYVAQGRAQVEAVRGAGLRTALRVQAAITIGLAPLGVLLFHQVSLVGPLANALAIPVVSFVVTPLALAGSALVAFAPFDSPFAWPLEAAHGVFAGLMAAIQAMAAWPFAQAAVAAPPPWAFAAAILGMLWCLAPPGVPARGLGLLWMAPLFLLPAPRPGHGEVWLTALDVGQGTAVLVETERHRLLYDTGPRYGADSDAGQRVIVPYLRARGIARLDGLVVSHSDNDHAGGALSVLQALPVAWTASSVEDHHPIMLGVAQPRRCFTGQTWSWDGVRFGMLHPAWEGYGRPAKPNARSCVVQIEAAGAGARRILLAGDVEAPEEAQLLQTARSLQADILLVPHHGSKTSSTAAFVEAVRPRMAVFQVGHRNRYGHPRSDVVARYTAQGADILRTDRDGAITIRLRADGSTEVERYRVHRARYWHGR